METNLQEIMKVVDIIDQKHQIYSKNPLGAGYILMKIIENFDKDLDFLESKVKELDRLAEQGRLSNQQFHDFMCFFHLYHYKLQKKIDPSLEINELIIKLQKEIAEIADILITKK